MQTPLYLQCYLMGIKTANMSYRKDFTIKPESKYLSPWDCSAILQDGQECCIVLANPYDESTRNVVATYRGGGFYRNTDTPRYGCVTEATPIAPESQWPTGSDWSTDDWEDRGIYPPRPVQPAVMIVELSDGRTFEVVAPFTDETPEGKQEQKDYQDDLDLFESNTRNLYRYATLPNKPTDKKITVSAIYWAWQKKPK